MKKAIYSPEIERQMRHCYRSLSEQDRRRYAAIEAIKLGYGGMTYISRLLRGDSGTVTRGRQELSESLLETEPRIRPPGGGQKSVLATTEGLDEAFLEVLRNYTAGSPTDETVKWTHLSRGEIAERLGEQGFLVSVTVVDPWLKKPGYRPRQAFKVEAGNKTLPNRDEPFKNRERLKEEYHVKDNPVMSMDVKKQNL